MESLLVKTADKPHNLTSNIIIFAFITPNRLKDRFPGNFATTAFHLIRMSIK